MSNNNNNQQNKNNGSSKKKNYAFIDSQNLNLATQNMGWNLDWNKFRKFLEEEYDVAVAYLFIGYIPENQDLYGFLQKAGFIVTLKPVVPYGEGEVKGNVDAELVLQAMIDYRNYDKAVIVSGDGDFHSLVNYLHQQNKLEALVVPNKKQFSSLLKDAARDRITYLNNLRRQLEYKKRR